MRHTDSGTRLDDRVKLKVGYESEFQRITRRNSPRVTGPLIFTLAAAADFLAEKREYALTRRRSARKSVPSVIRENALCARHCTLTSMTLTFFVAPKVGTHGERKEFFFLNY